MARQYDQQTTDGDHPFADDGIDVSQEQKADGDAPRSDAANPFSSSSRDPLYTTTPEYEVSYSGRGGAVLALGIVGVLSFAFTVYIAMQAEFPPFLLLSLAFTITAWQWGRRDLIAMRAGVMQTKGKGMTRVGVILGATTTALIAVIVIGWAAFKLVVWFRNWW